MFVMETISLTDRVARLLEAHGEYGSGLYDEVLSRVCEAVHHSGEIGKLEIGALTAWKRLRADTRWMKALMSTPDEEVRSITRQAVAAARDATLEIPESAARARKALLELDGCRRGTALPSAMLLAAAPTRMAVYDRRAQTAIDRLEGVSISGAQGFYRGYMSLVVRLMDEVNSSGRVPTPWVPRDVDMALYELGGRR